MKYYFDPNFHPKELMLTSRSFRSQVPADYLEMCQKQFVLSVPAVWSDKAKFMTQKAAKQAGIFPITLIKEPEAAAMYTLHMMQEKAIAVGSRPLLISTPWVRFC
jgi:hypothetical protein